MIGDDEKYMKRCIELAANGIGSVAPNPMVGAVIVLDGKIIGEGYHCKYGEAHAEVNAINSVTDQAQLANATVYVNLEPCAHYGKTPPCADLIVRHSLKRVVVGCTDSFAKVAGRGIIKLRDAGIEVEVGVLEAESRNLNRRFFTFHEQQRPYIVLKWAQTADGYIDINRLANTPQQPTWISDPLCRTYTHKWRSEEASILVGTNTALNDNPKLTIRNWCGENPVRVLIDRNLRLPSKLSIFDDTAPTIVFTSQARQNTWNTEYVVVDFTNNNLLGQILNVLHQKSLQSLIVEGGATLLQSFINQNLWDEARVFVADTWFGSGMGAPALQTTPVASQIIGNSRLFYFRNFQTVDC